MAEIISKKTLEVIAEVFAEYAEEFTALTKENLKKSGDDTGALYDSIRFEVNIANQSVSVDILMEDYAQFVDEGRSPGKQPPPDAIRSWVRSKGITNRDNSIATNSADIDSVAYVIGRSIGREGTRGKHFIPEIKEQEIVDRLEKRLVDTISEDVKEYILKGTSIYT